MNAINSIAGSVSIVFALGIFLADVLIAVGVFQDARARLKAGKRVVILSPRFWSVVCLFTTLPGLALYWAAHYSTFAKEGEYLPTVPN